MTIDAFSYPPGYPGLPLRSQPGPPLQGRDRGVSHGSAKKMPTELVKTLSQNASIVGRYIGEHRVFTPTILVIL